MRIAAIDPGKVCGLALLDTEAETVTSAQVPMDSVEERLGRWHEEGPLDMVVVERFVIYPWMAHKLKFHECPAAEAVGLVRSWVNRTGVTWYKQMASVRMRHQEQARASIGVSGHRVAALAHALCRAKLELGEVPGILDWKVKMERS